MMPLPKKKEGEIEGRTEKFAMMRVGHIVGIIFVLFFCRQPERRLFSFFATKLMFSFESKKYIEITIPERHLIVV